jgi:replicative DNA helicase
MALNSTKTDTAKMERELLKSMASSTAKFRECNARLMAEWLQKSKLRRMILAGIRDNYERNKAPFTDELFSYWIENSLSSANLCGKCASGELKIFVGALGEENYTCLKCGNKGKFNNPTGKTEIDQLKAEWTMIQGIKDPQEPGPIIDILEREAKLTDLISAIDKTAIDLDNGGKDFDELVQDLKGKLLRVTLRKDAKDTKDLTDFQHRIDEYELRKSGKVIKSYKTGLHWIDHYTGGLFPGEFSLFSALTGVGKSTLMKQIEVNLVTNTDQVVNVLHIANEENQHQVETKFDAAIACVPYHDLKMGTLTPGDREVWERRIRYLKEMQDNGHCGRIFVKEVPAFTTTDLIEQAYWEVKEKYGVEIHVIIIDHLPHLKPREKFFDLNDERAKAAGDCKELARSLNVAVLVPTQASTDTQEKQKRGHSPDDLGVFGSKVQIHVSNCYFAIIKYGYVKDQDKEYGTDDDKKDRIWKLTCKKNRDGQLFSCFMRHLVKCGMVIDCDIDGNMDTESLKKHEVWKNESLGTPLPPVVPVKEDEEKIQEAIPAIQEKPKPVAPRPTIDLVPESLALNPPTEKERLFAASADEPISPKEGRFHKLMAAKLKRDL